MFFYRNPIKNSVENCSNYVSTTQNSLTTKEVACQTTSDLHLALFMQEFPHLFQRSNLPSSIYDRPAQSGMKSNDDILSTIRTPESLLPNCNVGVKYMTISSIATSEKKRAEKDFACRSVLYDSIRTPLSCVRTNSPADISNISPLPTSGNKPYGLEINNSDPCKSNVKSTSLEGIKSCSKEVLVESPSIIPLLEDDKCVYSRDVIICTEDNATYCSNTAVERSLSSPPTTNNMNEGQSTLSYTSKEIEFADVNEDDEGAKHEERESCDDGRDVTLVFKVDPDYIPDSVNHIQDDVEIFKDEEKNKSQDVEEHRSPEVGRQEFSFHLI